MASWKLVAVAFALVACAVSTSSAQLQPLAPKLLGCPGAPWCLVKCDYTETPGASCQDCSTRLICTKVGGMVRPCIVPGWKHCVNGLCRPTPSAMCATEAPSEAPTEGPTEAPTEGPTEAPTEAPTQDPTTNLG